MKEEQLIMAQSQRKTTAPSLSVTCSANPGSGTAPLAVSFALNVSGAQGAISVRINYGDGSSGTEISPADVVDWMVKVVPLMNWTSLATP